MSSKLTQIMATSVVLLALALPVSASATSAATKSAQPAPPFSLNQEVTIPGSREWGKTVIASPGNTLSWMLSIHNPSKTNNLISAAVGGYMPDHLQLVNGSVTLFDSQYPNGKVVSASAFFGDGLKLPNLAPNATIYVRYRTVVLDDFSATTCSARINNLAGGWIGNKPSIDNLVFSTASATINRNCIAIPAATQPTPAATLTPTPTSQTTSLPETGAGAPVAATALGLSALGFVGYYYARQRQAVRSSLLRS